MNTLTLEGLWSLLHYDPESGVLKWAKSQGSKASGSVAGTLNESGYRYIQLFGRFYREHRLIWVYMTGRWPKEHLDHINGVKDDNRFENLRECTHGENMRYITAPQSNNRAGYRGMECVGKKFRARIRVAGSIQQLGLFDTPEAAHAAYLEAKGALS